ncbi:MAG: transketolase C-terminal domain-containing protein, partial [Atribacterota bacterium]
LAALSGIQVIYVFTHDSVGLGEDGPTHQPVEQVASLRAIPHLTIIRPCDGNETAEAWKVAVEQTGSPVALILSRQNLPVIDRSQFAPAEGLRQGAYILADCPSGRPELILMASGSEVILALEACEKLTGEGFAVRVVSMPSWELFESQPEEYRRAVFPPEVTHRLAIEAGVTQGWHKYVGSRGDVLGIDRFGASAPGKVVLEKFGFTVQNVMERARALIQNR